jgi:hypothetical protein
MATHDAGQEGMLSIGHSAGGDGAMPVATGFNPAAYNQTYLAFYKMQGKCSIHDWDSWCNATGDEAGRDIHGTQEAGTIIASWFIPQGF